MLLVASSLGAKSLFDRFCKGIRGPRAQHSYDNSTKTKSHLVYSGAPNLLTAHKNTDVGSLKFVF